MRSGALDAAPESITWPLPKLFHLQDQTLVLGPRRMRLSVGAEGTAAWFDCHSFALEGGVLRFAIPADARNNFV